MQIVRLAAVLLMAAAFSLAPAAAHDGGSHHSSSSSSSRSSAFVHVPAQSLSGTFAGLSGSGYLVQTSAGVLTLPAAATLFVNGVPTPAASVAVGTPVRVRTPALHGSLVSVDGGTLTVLASGRHWTLPLSGLGQAALHSSRVWVRTPDGRTGLVSLATALNMRNQGAVILAGDLDDRRGRRSDDDDDDHRGRGRGSDDD